MSSRNVRCVAAVVLGCSWAGAATATPPVSVRYRAPERADAPGTCPSSLEFERAIRRRGGDLDSAEAALRASAIEVQIRYRERAYFGELVVRSPDGGAATRTVFDADCSQVASGLAWTAAIALGGSGEEVAPELDTGASLTSSVEPESRASVEIRKEAEPEPEPQPEAARSGPGSRLRGSAFDQTDSIAVTAGTLELDGARAYTLTGGAQFGLIPGQVVPRYDLGASLAGFFTPPRGESRLFGPVLQVDWAVLGPVTSRHPGGVSLDTWGLEVGIHSCTALTYDTRGWVALACAEFGAGWLFLQAKAPAAAAAEDTRGYGFGGLGFDLQYNLGSLAHLGLRVGGRVNTPVRAEGPDRAVLFESSVWGGYATIGAGLHF